MQKFLLSTTALVAFSVIAVTGAYAAETKQDGVKLNLGGYYTVQGAYVNQDDGANDPGNGRRDHDILSYGEVQFQGEKTFDNGLTAGAKVVLKAQNSSTTNSAAGQALTTAGDDIQENFIYMSGNWGRVEAGQNFSPIYMLSVMGPSVDEGIDGRDPDFQFVATGVPGAVGNTGGNAAPIGFTPFYQTGNLLGDKVVYYTPRFNGFQAGVSYTADGTRTGVGKAVTGGVGSNSDAGQQGERWEMAANYETKYKDWGILVGGGYGFADLEGNVANTNLDNQTSWTAGAQLAYMGFAFGGAYLRDDNGSSNVGFGGVTQGDTDGWQGGVSYTTGPWKAGVSYLNNQTEVIRGAFAGDDKFERWTLGGSYALAPGVSLGSTLQFVDFESATPNGTVIGGTTYRPNNDATVVTLGTTVSF